MGTSSPPVIEAIPTSQTASTGKRQRRSLELKRQIVEETLVAGASVARIARAHGVNAKQVFYWRQLYRRGRLGNPTANAARLLPVSVEQTIAGDTIAGAAVSGPAQEGRNGGGRIHLELRKARVRIEGNIDPAVLRLVLEAVVG